MRDYELDLDYEGQSKFGLLTSNSQSGRDYNSTAGHTDQPITENDTITKFTASYQKDENTLMYFTRSEGYRPGGWNRNAGVTPNVEDMLQLIQTIVVVAQVTVHTELTYH